MVITIYDHVSLTKLVHNNTSGLDFGIPGFRCVWYCDSFSNYNLKKIVLKNIFLIVVGLIKYIFG